MTLFNNVPLRDYPLPPKISLNGTTCLVESFFNAHPEGMATKEVFVSKKEYPLREVTVEEIISLRCTSVPGFVLKKDGHYYYTQIHKDMKFTGSDISGTHLCGEKCRHCSAAPDKDGGCAKVRDIPFSSFNLNNFSLSKVVKASERIEKYDFILEGFESFNTVQESLVVTKCTNFEYEPVRPPVPLEEARRARLAVAQFVWPDVNSMGEVAARYSKLQAEKENRAT